jgi:diaminopimelate epimerase
MKIPFYKYEGTGNDFILVDNRQLGWRPVQKAVAFLCDRHFGIGADGLMLLTEQKEFDFRMTYFNSDGLESSMCGNGGRCMTAFADTLGLGKETKKFSAVDGPHESRILRYLRGGMQVTLHMKDVIAAEKEDDHYFIHTGSPHYVRFSTDVGNANIVVEGRKVRYSSRFEKEGTNVDLVEVFPDHLFVRSYERGVEDETLSCGTGVTASAIAAAMEDPENPGYFDVRTRGGDLKVSFSRVGNAFREIWLEGPVNFVFSGEMDTKIPQKGL